MFGPVFDHHRFEELVLELHAAVQSIPRQRDFTVREKELLSRLNLHIAGTLPCAPLASFHARQPGSRFSAMNAGDVQLRAFLARLTRAEWELVVLLRQGLSNKEIAGHLSKSIRTVKGQLTSVYKKSGVKSRSRLLVLLPPLSALMHVAVHAPRVHPDSKAHQLNASGRQ